MRGLDKLIAPMRRRIAMMVARALVKAVDDGSTLQGLRLAVMDDELQDGVERFQNYGLTSCPKPGAEAAVIYVGGLRAHGLVIAVDDRRYRLTGLQEGEVALYDDQGQTLHLQRDGVRIETSLKVEIVAAGDVKVAAGGNALIEAASLDLGGIGGQPVARKGDAVSGGIIVGGSAKVKSA